jgi:hypothetical protein
MLNQLDHFVAFGFFCRRHVEFFISTSRSVICRRHVGFFISSSRGFYLSSSRLRLSKVAKTIKFDVFSRLLSRFLGQRGVYFSLFYFPIFASNGRTHAVPPCVGFAGWAWAA